MSMSRASRRCQRPLATTGAARVRADRHRRRVQRENVPLVRVLNVVRLGRAVVGLGAISRG
jgi:hypothetical protein